MLDPEAGRSAAWKWTVCGLLFLATLLNYMDRQALSQTSKQILQEMQFGEKHYGRLEWAFGLAFAAGGLTFGFLADKVNVWTLYPIVLVGWSAVGFLTGSADAVGDWVALYWPEWAIHQLGIDTLPTAARAPYLGLFTCRTLLGLFEAGQWPCALVTTQRLLSQRDRPFGNSLLQSGASIGAILTPLAKTLIVSDKVPGSWSMLFQSIGAVGVLWIIPWFLLIRPRDLARTDDVREFPDPAPDRRSPEASSGSRSIEFVRMYLAVALTVILINIPWHFYRAWMPLFLEKFHGYDTNHVAGFTMLYYGLTDVGCIGFGFAIGWLARHRLSVHSARMVAFAACAVLTGIGALAGLLPAGPGLLIVLLINALGSLALFPIYYSLTQELSSRHQGKVTGTLSCLTWICTAMMQQAVGTSVQESKSYTLAFLLTGVAPLVALGAILLLWPRNRQGDASKLAFH